MPVVGDYINIVGDEPVKITGTAEILPEFNTAGRNTVRPPLLVFAVKAITNTVNVRVNDKVVGQLVANPTDSHWYTQMVYMPGNGLNNGDNILRFDHVDPNGEANGDFFVKQVTCFYGQSA